MDMSENYLSEDAQLAAAMRTLENFIKRLCVQADKGEEYANELWKRISNSTGVLQEVAYYHDYGKFLGKYEVSGYTLPDILVWQVDHFKAYMDRHLEMNRYRRERLLLEALETMLNMEENPAPYIEKMRNESGTDFVDKY
ncbi:MAG: hypothetical protein LUG83_03695 [Lachnospiraceae bacterium]|nr:hypothetical protein [Lachnospiraceae bacterium]